MRYDLCVIGAGWAGFNAALRAAKAGKSVCLVERDEVGGTCLNRGCIPTKVFVHYSKNGAALQEIRNKKTEVIQRLKSGMAFLLKSHKIDLLRDSAKITNPGELTLASGSRLGAADILLAAGSVPKDLPHLKIDHQKILSSDDLLELEELPKKILIIGAGAIGCEFASVLGHLGVDVTVTEIENQLLPGVDVQLSKKLQQIFQKRGINIHLGDAARSLDASGFEKVLLCAGRKPVTDCLGEGIGVGIDKGGFVVDRELKTDLPHIWAAGDCVGGYMLAHVASYEGELAVGNILGVHEKRNYSVIPASVFTDPEVASVGLSEEEAKRFGMDYTVGVAHFLSVGMAHIHGQTQGFVKVLAEKKSGRVLGAGIIGEQASELVNFFSLVMKNKISIQDVKKTIFAHPSISEVISEVAGACL